MTFEQLKRDLMGSDYDPAQLRYFTEEWLLKYLPERFKNHKMHDRIIYTLIHWYGLGNVKHETLKKIAEHFNLASGTITATRFKALRMIRYTLSRTDFSIPEADRREIIVTTKSFNDTNTYGFYGKIDPNNLIESITSLINIGSRFDYVTENGVGGYAEVESYIHRRYPDYGLIESPRAPAPLGYGNKRQTAELMRETLKSIFS